MRCEPRLSPIITVLLPSCGLLLVTAPVSQSLLDVIISQISVMEDGAAVQTVGHQAQAQV